MKKLKNLWDKYKAMLFVELIVIVTIVGCIGLTYKVTFNLELQKAKTVGVKLSTLTGGGSNLDKDEFLTNLDDTLSFASFDYWHGDYYNISSEYTGYAFVWKAFDDDYNCLVKSDGCNFMLGWYPPDSSDLLQYREMLMLENYFTEEEMEKFLEFYKSGEVSLSNNNIYIDKVTGYYNEKNEFVPIEVFFSIYDERDEDGKTKKYVLSNSENKDKEGIDYVTVPGDSKDSNRSEKDSMKGYFSLWHYPISLPSAIDNARYRIDKGMDGLNLNNMDDSGCYYWCYDSWFGEGDSFPINGMDMMFCADIKYMTLINIQFRKYVKLEIIVCQLIGIILMYIIYKNEKRRRYLDSMKYTFINAMAHEMKTPSAVVVNSVECIKDGIKPEKQSKYLDKVKKEGLHMNRLLLDMLTYTKLTDQERKINKEEVNMRELLEEVIGHYADAIEKKNIELKWDVQSENIIMADRKLIEMVVDNYLSNAVKYCNPSGIIKILITEKNIVVYNDGENIHGTKLKAIWEPLYVMDESRKNREGSSGMGLAISAKIMDLHGMQYGTRNADDGVEFYINM